MLQSINSLKLNLSKTKGTFVGLIAPLFWSTTAVVSNVVFNVPKFQLLSIAFLFCLIQCSLFENSKMGIGTKLDHSESPKSVYFDE